MNIEKENGLRGQVDGFVVADDCAYQVGVDFAHGDETLDQVAAISAEVGKCCDPYDGEQEAYENSIGRGFSKPVIYIDTEIEELTQDDIASLEDTIVTDKLDFTAVEVQDHGFQTQDNLVYFLDMLIKQYLVLRVKYHAGVEGADKLSLVDKLKDTFTKAITLNNITNEETVEILLQDVCDVISNEMSFTVAFYSSLAQLILDRTIDVSDTASTRDLNASYKAEYMKQLTESALPNMLEDLRIYFNTPKIDQAHLQDILDIIVDEQPDCVKYRMVKLPNEDNIEVYKIVLILEDISFAPVIYKLKLEFKDDTGNVIERTLASFVATTEDIKGLLDLYMDVNRWSNLIEA